MARIRLTAGRAPAIRYRRGHYTLLQQYADEMQRRPTATERRMLELLRRDENALGCHFLTQVVMEGSILDFYEPKLRLCIEVDGVTHADDRAQRRDAARDRRLEEVGVATLRVRNGDVWDRPEKVRLQVECAIEARRSGKTLPVMMIPSERRRALKQLRRLKLRGPRLWKALRDPKYRQALRESIED